MKVLPTKARARLDHIAAQLPVAHLFSRTHARVFRWSRGRIAPRWGGTPILVLETRGRKTGKTRLAPVIYLRDGSDLVVFAAAAGSDKAPAWWRNLQAEPHATVTLRGDGRVRVRARRAEPAERERLWPRFVAGHPAAELFATYTSRDIPMVILEPA
ncbi:nitroreductase/quinone reductase family protein [Nocardia sp. NPDC003482]